MLIRVDQEVWTEQCTRIEDFRSVWEDIVQHLSRQQKVIHYVEAGSEVLYEHYLEYIDHHFESISSVHVRTMPEETLLTESLAELRAYNRKLLDACDSIGSLFYGEMTSENWEYFQSLLNGLRWVFEAVVGTSGLMQKQGFQTPVAAKLHEVFQQLAQQIGDMENQLNDGQLVSVGDIIKYEITDTLKLLDEHLAHTEVNR